MNDDGKSCGTCRHNKYDSDSGDFVCTNSSSEYFADWVGCDNSCEEWEERE